MTAKRNTFALALCGLALVGAGCGGDDDEDTLSSAETAEALNRICADVSAAGTGLNGQPKNDTPILREKFIPAYEKAIRKIRDLDVPDDLSATHDAFADVSQRQLPVMKEARALAEKGDTKTYRAKVEEVDSFRPENDRLARRLGASACGGE